MRPDDRLLVLGGGGWFGTSLLETLGSVLPESQVQAVAARKRDLRLPQANWHLDLWDPQRIHDFAPTVVANFAFLTRDKIALLGEREFRETNEELLARFEWVSTLKTVRAVLTASSGAVLSESPDAYGQLKLQEERIARASRSATRSSVIARAFSVSGPWVQRPEAYAFSDLVGQAGSGEMYVVADRPTWRRYVDAGDFLAVALALALAQENALVESGGELIEMRDLARKVRAVVNPGASLNFEEHCTTANSIYASDGLTWQKSCESLSYRPIGLVEQIRRTAAVLVPSVSAREINHEPDS